MVMEMEKTTILSFVVGMAGVLAEIIFHNILSRSVWGMLLSVVLGMVILCCAYFVLDGLRQSLSSIRKKEENRRREYDEKMYRLLNKRLSEMAKLQRELCGRLEETASKEQQMISYGTADDKNGWKELAEGMHEDTLKAAKLIVRYGQKNQEKSQQAMEQSAEELLKAVQNLGLQAEQLQRLVRDSLTVSAQQNRTKLIEPILMEEEKDSETMPDPLKNLFAEERGSSEEETEAFSEILMETQEQRELLSRLMGEDMTEEEPIVNPVREESPAVKEVVAVTQEAEESLLGELLATGGEEPDKDEQSASILEAADQTVDEVAAEFAQGEQSAEPTAETMEKEKQLTSMPELPVIPTGQTALDMLLNKLQKETESVPGQEDIAAKIETQPAPEETSESSSEAEPESEAKPLLSFPELDMSDPNKVLSPDDIAALFSSIR